MGESSKTCHGCGTSKLASAFAKDRTTLDGLSGWCRDCRNAAGRKRYLRKGPPDHHGARPLADRAGDRRQARHRVNHQVDIGSLPDPNTIPCVDCGHVWAKGERRHEYDHHLGYGVGRHLEVVATCSRCHHWRERERVA